MLRDANLEQRREALFLSMALFLRLGLFADFMDTKIIELAGQVARLSQASTQGSRQSAPKVRKPQETAKWGSVVSVTVFVCIYGMLFRLKNANAVQELDGPRLSCEMVSSASVNVESNIDSNQRLPLLLDASPRLGFHKTGMV